MAVYPHPIADSIFKKSLVLVNKELPQNKITIYIDKL